MSKLLVIFLLLLMTPVKVSAQLSDLDSTFYIPNASCNPLTIDSSAMGNNVFYVGDSLMVGMARAGLLATTKNSGATLTKDEYTEEPFSLGNTASTRIFGGSIEAINAIDISSMTPRIIETDIAHAGKIVIGLGQNDLDPDGMINKIGEIIGVIRGINRSNPEIHWVNLYFTADNPVSYADKNEIINQAAGFNNFRVIDFASEATANPDLYPFQDDGVHHNSVGDQNKVNFIVSQLGYAVSGGSNTTPGGDVPQTGAGIEVPQSASSAINSSDPITLGFPNLANEAEVINNINEYIRGRNANSRWFLVDQNIGQWLFDQSKPRGINPLLIFGVGLQENQFGKGDNDHVRNGHNYFGMTTGSGGSRVYRTFSSPTHGMTTFLDEVKRRTQGNDRGNFVDVKNFFDYMSVHQSGRIAYPGEELDPTDWGGPVFDSSGKWVKGARRPDGNRMDGYDPIMGVYISWTVTQHPNPAYNGNLYNPGIYYKNVITAINRVTGLSLSDIPSRGPAGSGLQGSCDDGGRGSVIIDGYSFPIEPQKKPIPGINSGHHDETPAFDLFGPKKDAGGDEVYALFDGEIIRIGVQEEGWCYSIQLKASDGFYYWYGHLNNLNVNPGDKVTSGQKLGVTAAWTAEHTCGGSSGAAHLHIDRGCIINGVAQTGGEKACRDPDFVPFLRQIYERLP